MKRNLLFLPSSFVLLLVVGIAFLAAPVVDVHAALSGTPTIAKTTPTGATAGVDDDEIVVTITFAAAVRVTGEAYSGGPAWTIAQGFGVEDLIITTDQSQPTDTQAVMRSPEASQLAKMPTTQAAGEGTTFTVTVDVPSNASGNITIALRPAGTGVAFTERADANNAYVATTGALVTGVTVPYDTYDATAPVVVITGAAGTTVEGSGPTQTISRIGGEGAEDVFQLKVAVTEDSALAANQALVMSEVSVATTMPAPAAGATEGSRVVRVWADPATTASDTTVAYIVVIDPADDVTEVEITVAEDAFTNAGGNGNEETKKKVSINTPPTVTMSAVTQPVPSTVSSLAVTFQLSVNPPDSGSEAFLAADIALTNGATLTAGPTRDITIAPTDTVKATYNATITLPAFSARRTPVTITVAADSFEDRDVADIGNVAFTRDITVAVPDPDTAPPPPPTATPTGTGGALTSPARDGFEFKVNVAANAFIVLAKSPANAGFTAAAGDFTITYEDERTPATWATKDRLADANRIDIADNLWVDLRHFFVGREGGSIDLIGTTGTTKVRELVISEVMWGNDNGKAPPSDSQWIELYNTTGTAISGNFQLVFHNKAKGAAMLANDAVTSTAAPVVDKLSTWRNVGSTWAWSIADTTGGSHGQSGKSTLNSATSPGSPVELVSMQRKIDYVGKVEKAGNDRAAQLKDFPNGATAGGWEATKEHGNMDPYRKGTPGVQPVIVSFDQTPVPRGSVVFNEIANRSDKKHEWIELHNKSDSAKKINNWELSLVSIKDNERGDREVVVFTSDNDINVPAKGYLLIVNSKDSTTRLEGGYNVTDPGSSERSGAEAVRPYYVTDKLDIPNEKFLLILRHGNDKNGTHEKIEDIAGFNPDFEDADINTEVWPLRSWTLGATDDLSQKNDKTWVRDQGKAVFNGDEWKPDGGFTGVGIARQYDASDNYTSGTPGYANNAVQNEVKSDGLTDANPVIISEIMFATTDSSAPQWIELYNPSLTQAVNLNKWKLEVVNYHGDATLQVNEYTELVLPEKRIQPNQTVLIVSRKTSRMSGSDAFPDDRIIGIWNETALRKAFAMQNQRHAVLSSEGFHLRLSDPKKVIVDEVGNIDANHRNNDDAAWDLPTGNSEEGSRISMVRDLEGSANDGTTDTAWRSAAVVDSSTINTDANELYYGDPDDVGTPGYTPGGVLPVQLSSFYSKRNDAGAVIITWATESELDNAGFNILRSVSRTGEFTRINAQLIPGAGTTGEKNTYTWTDTSARPNVVYYYQIEDVSLDGEHRTLRTTRLRGHVGAAGKATIIWGELKSRD